MSLMLQNFVLFQIGWFGCVISGASKDYSWAGMVIVAIIVTIHLSRATYMLDEIMLIATTTVVGTAWDSTLTIAGLFAFSNGVIISWLVPLWMVAMWALFATTLNVSMKWMKDRYILAAVFGAAGGPLAYYAGHRIGAVDFNNTLQAMIAVSVGWAVIMPGLMYMTKRFNGYHNSSREALEVKTV